MFTVNNYKVEFAHAKVIFEDKKTSDGVVDREVTFCKALDELTGDELQVKVVRYHKDRNDKNKARKYALAKLLRTMFPSNKEEREKFWQAYFAARGRVN